MNPLSYISPQRRLVFLFIAATVFSGVRGIALADWPQFLGPHRNGSATETNLTAWPKEGLTQRWKVRVGTGFSGPIISGNSVTLFHKEEGMEVVSTWNVTNGQLGWVRKWPTTFSDEMGSGDGPRSTPSIAQGRVFALGPDGTLHALSATTGEPLWQLNLVKQFGSDPGFFGYATSPLVLGEQLIIQAGGMGSGTVALAVTDGRVLWKSGSDASGCSSPIPWTPDGKTHVLCFNRAGAVAHDLLTGAELFRFPWRARMHASVNAASPIAVEKDIFLTSSYGAGAAWIRPKAGAVEVLWSGDEALSAHFSTPVESGGFLYGFHGRHESGPALRCIQLSTGIVRWTLDRFGSGSIIRVGSRLLILLESGELVLMEANPLKSIELARSQVAGNGARIIPALADGRLFLRDRSHLICLALPALAGKP